jgi:hypothetical protein
MRKIVILAVLLTTITLSYFYFQLGGVSDIQKDIVAVDAHMLVAKSFKGKYNSAQLEGLFYQVKSMGDQLVIVNYPLQGDSTENGFIHQLIGTQVTSMPDKAPAGFAQNEIGPSKVVRATIDAHNLVMPKPDEIEAALRDYGKEQNLTLVGYTIERYLSDREQIIDIPIIE